MGRTTETPVETVTPDEWSEIARAADEAGSVLDHRGGLRWDVHVPIGGGWETRRYFVKPGLATVADPREGR